MITSLALIIYRYSKLWYYMIGLASFVISVLLLPTIQSLLKPKISSDILLSAASYLIAFILATVILPNIGYWIVKSQLIAKAN